MPIPPPCVYSLFLFLLSGTFCWSSWAIFFFVAFWKVQLSEGVNVLLDSYAQVSAKGVVEHFIILLKIKLTLSNVCYTLGHQINCSNPRFTSHGFILAVRIMVQSIIVTRQRKTVMYLVECVGFYTFLIILIPIHGNWKKGLMSLIWYHLALLCLGMLA